MTRNPLCHWCACVVAWIRRIAAAVMRTKRQDNDYP
jgi:hypothetical protein